jgi:arylsulfatase A-like enzyme
MRSSRPRGAAARIKAGSLLVAAAFGACDGRAVPQPTTAAAAPEPRLRSYPLAEEREFDLALLVDGAAEAALIAKTNGALVVTIEQDGGATAEIRVELAGDGSPCQFVLPGAKPRAVRLRSTLPAGVELASLRVRDQPQEIGGGDAAGAWRGRSVAVVVCDALHAAHLSCYGADQPTSPQIDALARDGVRFAAFRSQTAWTVPSVATLFTGATQEAHGVRDVGQVLAATWPTLAEAFAAAGYATAAFVQNKLVTRETGLDRGFDEWREYPGESRNLLLPELEAFLAAPRNRPLFLYVHLLPPHAPYQPPPEFAGRFGQPKGAIDGGVRSLGELAQREPKASDPHVVTLRGLYRNHVAYGDALAGTVARAFLGRDPDRAALLLLSDHGEAFGQHEAVGHNVQVFDEMVHVPLVAVAPGSMTPAGRVVDAPCFMPDLVPTLVDLCALPHAPEDDSSLRAAGRSLAGAFAPAVTEFAPRLQALSARFLEGDARQRALVFGRFKLVAPAGRRATALYDLSEDPSESADASARHPVLAAALRAELATFAATARESAAAGTFEPDAKLRAELEALGYGAAGGR